MPTAPGCAGDDVGEGGVEVEPDLGVASLDQPTAQLGLLLRAGVGSAEEAGEVEAGLGVGDDTEGLGLADLEGVAVTERAEGFCFGADDVVEPGQVQGVPDGVDL